MSRVIVFILYWQGLPLFELVPSSALEKLAVPIQGYKMPYLKKALDDNKSENVWQSNQRYPEIEWYKSEAEIWLKVEAFRQETLRLISFQPPGNPDNPAACVFYSCSVSPKLVSSCILCRQRPLASNSSTTKGGRRLQQNKLGQTLAGVAKPAAE